MNVKDEVKGCNEFANALRFGKMQKAICAAGADAVKRLEEETWHESSQGIILRQFMLGLFNSPKYPFDLRSLMELDIEVHADCIAVLKMEYAPEHSFESNFRDGAALFKFLETWHEDYAGTN